MEIEPTPLHDKATPDATAHVTDADGVTVHVVDADGGNDLELTQGRTIEPLELGNGELWWSPDGKLIATSVDQGEGRWGTLLLLADGSGVDRLPLSIDAAFPAWSPDGSHLAFRGRDPADPVGTDGLWVATLDGTGLERIWTPPSLAADTFELEPQWSPDGAAIALACCGRVEVVAADGSGPQTLAEGSDHWPTWSHDGEWIAFQESLGHPNYGLRLIRPDGSGARDVGTDATAASGFLGWAPDDSAVLAFIPSIDSLIIAPLDGSAPTTIPQGRSLGKPSWQRLH